MDTMMTLDATNPIITLGRPVFSTDAEREGIIFDSAGGAAQVEWNDTCEKEWFPTRAFAEGGRYDDLYVNVETRSA